jgi:methenyltetrahydromethanopterin cyclohydrolase
VPDSRLCSERSADTKVQGAPIGPFAAAGHDFYKIDAMLFSPAKVTVTALATGRSFTAGALAPELLARSFAVG